MTDEDFLMLLGDYILHMEEHPDLVEALKDVLRAYGVQND
jgi:hypothetical protein